MSVPAVRSALAPNPSEMTLEGTYSYVVGWGRPVVIDPGPAIASHIERLLEMLDGVAPLAIVVTHAHADHSAAAPVLAERTGAPIWTGRGALSDPFPPGAGRHEARDGELLDSDAGLLRLLETPGHAPEHICVFWQDGRAPPGGALFAGDLLMGRGDTTLIAPPEGDLEQYLRSLDRVRELSPAVIYPAHGPPILDPGAAVQRYRTHRLQRLDQVRRALDTDPSMSLEELLSTVYGKDLPAELQEAAKGSLRALVHYLRAFP